MKFIGLFTLGAVAVFMASVLLENTPKHGHEGLVQTRDSAVTRDSR